jgi:hypothetical protein
MNRYTVEETYIYEVFADNEEAALEQFQQFMETGEGTETQVAFLDNQQAIFDSEGNEL